jgi:membrane protease YdiL (CAAX protease family)
MTEPQPVFESVQRQPRSPFWGWTDIGIFFLLAAPCLLAAALGGNALFHLLATPVPLAMKLMTIQFAGYGLWFGALWLLLRVRYGEPFWSSMGWTSPWPGGWAVAALGPALAAALALLGVALRTPVVDNPMLKLLQDRTSVLIIGFFAVTLGPLAEELIFRGFVQPVMVRTLGAAAGVALASAPFALLHGPQYGWSWQHVLLLFLASAAFGAVRLRTGSTAASTLMHAAYNLTFLAGYAIQKREILF